jgi:hypothetical protein
LAAVLDDVGATLPARDAVDLRIVREVAAGGGHIIEKETALPETDRWPDYRSLPPPADTDRDGLPDFWERQFGLDPQEASDGARIVRGYANIEHYFNNTEPAGGETPVVWIAATASRARTGQAGEWRVTRSGSTSAPLAVRYEVRGDAESGRDFTPLGGSLQIPAGKRSAVISLELLTAARDDKTVVVSLVTKQQDCHVGCPAESLVVIRSGR